MAVALASDWAAASAVQLDLPETRVCSTNPGYSGDDRPVTLTRVDTGRSKESADGCCG